MTGPSYAMRWARTCANCRSEWWTTLEWTRWSALYPDFYLCPNCRCSNCREPGLLR